jgi:DNA repair protein RadC
MMDGQIAIAGFEKENKIKKSSSFSVRVNERISKYGVETINEAEIVSVLTGIPVEKLDELIAEHGIINLARIMDSIDITDAQRRKLSMVFEISRKIGISKVKEKEALDSSSKAGEYFVSLLKMKPVEEFVLAMLNSQNKLIKTIISCKGTINESPIYPREVVKAAILHNAVSVIFAHNHRRMNMLTCDFKHDILGDK